MSKAGMPRWRYVALGLSAATPLDRQAADATIAQALRTIGVAAQLTRFSWPHAIVRVAHRDMAAARAALPLVRADARGRPLRIETLLSSGTILTITQRLGILTERGPRSTGATGAAGAGASRGPPAHGARPGGHGRAADPPRRQAPAGRHGSPPGRDR